MVNQGKGGNAISFKPRKTGSFKFLVKESVLIEPTDKMPFSIDINIFTKGNKGSLGTVTNELIISDKKE